ncbi:MAG TPA: zinc-ribbon domain-containing protein [Thermoplasmata archaeon]|nr:zinc-ribbon domain-containing protein [Thermoplasmata archaeon]
MLAALPIAYQVEVLFGGVFLALCVLVFVIFLLIAIWVYRDAESRGMSGVLWLILVLLFPLIGLIIYLVVRHDKVQPMMAPPYYGQQPWQPPPGGAAPPPAGGAPSAQMTCRNCGSPLAPGATFCGKCGAKV